MGLAALIALVAAAAASAPATTTAATATPGHVWTIVLENKNYEKTFAKDSKAPYLATELPAKGALLPNYYATGHLSLDNYISMVSGQAPNPITQSDCQLFQEFVGAAGGPDGQAIGQGCVYPAAVKTVADQLVEKKLRYRGYMEDMGDDPARENATCAHPALGGRDNTQSATEKDQYATRHNPFMYFHSIIDDQPGCDKNVVNLSRLDDDLRSASLTPQYSFITPDLCSDGHDEACANPQQKGGYEGINEFLEKWVPKILASPAYKQDGLLIITFDEAEDDDTACCDEPTGPNTPRPGINGSGGGKVGAVLLSPLIEPGTTVDTPINHYGYLRSIEDFFGLEPLGYAGQEGLATFAAMHLFTRTPPSGGGVKAVKHFSVKRKGGRLIIRLDLAPGVVGRITVRRAGKVLRRFTTGGKATLKVKAPRKAKVVLRAQRDGATVKTLTKRR
jgi:hypothetical protein